MKEIYRPMNIFFTILLILAVVLVFLYTRISSELDRAENKVSQIIGTEGAVEFAGEATPNEVLYITTGFYPPYVYEEDGKITGLDYDILIAVLDEMGVKYKIEMLSWARGLYLLDSGDAFATFPYARSESREESYIFSDKFYDVDRYYEFYTYDEDSSFTIINDLEDLKRMKLGAVKGYFYLDLFDSYGLDYDISIDEKEALMKLREGRIDTFPMNPFVAKYFIETYFPQDVESFRTNELRLDLPEMGDFLMLDKENQYAEDFLTEFNRVLETLEENGTIENIIRRYID